MVHSEIDYVPVRENLVNNFEDSIAEILTSQHEKAVQRPGLVFIWSEVMVCICCVDIRKEDLLMDVAIRKETIKVD